MFNYSEKTKVDIKFKMLDLFKTIKADKSVKTDAGIIVSVILSNTLSPEKTNMEASENVKEIYVIDIILNSKRVPEIFVDAFNRFIEFQTLFRLHFQDEIKYLVAIKTFSDEKMKILKTFESNWKKEEKFDFPFTTKLEKVFKEMLKYVVGYAFRQDESFENYVKRLDEIKKLKSEIDKQTRLMTAEKQPNIKMAMNDKIKKLKKELQMLED